MFMCPIPYKLSACAECLAVEGKAPCQAICISKSIYVGKLDELLEKQAQLGSNAVLFLPRRDA